MSKHANLQSRESRLHCTQLRDFTYSVDVKRFSKERGSGTPMARNTAAIYRRLAQRSSQKIRNSQPSTLGQGGRHVQTKRKLSSGFTVKGGHSLGMDQHLLRERMALVKDCVERGSYQKAVPVIRQLLPYVDKTQGRRLYYWLAEALWKTGRATEGVEELEEGLALQPGYAEGHVLAGRIHLGLKNFRLAEEHLRAAVRMEGGGMEAYELLVECYRGMGEDKERELLEALIERFPRDGRWLLRLVQVLISAGSSCDDLLHRAEGRMGVNDSLYLCARGLSERAFGNFAEAYILFEQAVKFNTNRIGASRALLEMIRYEIDQRDFYKAHHSVGRMRLLELWEGEEVVVYAGLIEGVMAMMKKKSREAVDRLLEVVAHPRSQTLGLRPLLCKYLGYGYFKLGQYDKCVQWYCKLTAQEEDQSSSYNRLLAEGVELADRGRDFTAAMEKFQKAKGVYPQKVEPYVYIAMCLVQRQSLSSTTGRLQESLVEALRELQLGSRLNPNSSNLLYHRTIIHLYFEDWTRAQADINRCIEKAEENLPKYFFLRGVTLSCQREFRRAANEFAICLSLDPAFAWAHLEKAKCYFLLGSSEKGFSSLRQFMELSPEDLSIYQWIGDLLYEGRSYADALKAYGELSEGQETGVMRARCLMRIGPLQEVGELLHGSVVDGAALALLQGLVRGERGLAGSVGRLNRALEEGGGGGVFQLIDCMNLLAVAAFYLSQFGEAHQSCLLVLELFRSLNDGQALLVRSQESSEEELDLRLQDVYFNAGLALLACGKIQEGVRVLSEQLLPLLEGKHRKKLEKVLAMLLRDSGESIDWQFRSDKPVNAKLRKIDISLGRSRLRSRPVFNLFHTRAGNLCASEVAERMVAELHVFMAAGYIDSMPQGPWIKRNNFGVVFTEEIVPEEGSLSLADTFRQSESREEESGVSEMEGQEVELLVAQQQQTRRVSRREEFLQRLRLEEKVETKLNNLIQKGKG